MSDRKLYGLKWCVAQRMTDALRRKGYEVALHPTRYRKEMAAWAGAHPAFRLVETLPESPEKQLIMRAVLRELGA